jgi:acyl carrier protein
MHARQLIAEVLRTSVAIPRNDVLLAHIEGWDSLKGVRLVLRLEEIVGRELSEDDIEKLQSVEDVDRLLKAA